MAAGRQIRRIESPGRRQSALLIDLDHLESLSRHIGRTATCELLAVGRTELTEQLDRLERLDGEIGPLAHQVCGVAGTLGLSLIAHHAACASEACRAGGDTDFPRLALLDAAGPSLAALDAWRAAAREDGA